MQLSRVRLSPVEKNIRPWRPEFGPDGKHFVTGNSLFFVFGGAAKLRWAVGRAAPVGRGNELKKTGARSTRARTRSQKPTSMYIILCYNLMLDEARYLCLPFSIRLYRPVYNCMIQTLYLCIIFYALIVFGLQKYTSSLGKKKYVQLGGFVALRALALHAPRMLKSRFCREALRDSDQHPASQAFSQSA